jgi:hypothetical protein
MQMSARRTEPGIVPNITDGNRDFLNDMWISDLIPAPSQCDDLSDPGKILSRSSSLSPGWVL